MDLLFGLATALPIVSATGVSAVTGVAQGVSEQKKHNADASNASRMLKFHLDVSLPDSHHELAGYMITLHDSRLWLDRRSESTGLPQNITLHPFTGFYVAYPDDARPHTRGLVSTISANPPALNWVYVDKDTYEVRYSNRTGSIAHHVGSFDWTNETAVDSRITLDEFEGFVAVQENTGEWALYFDLDDDGLRTKKGGRKVVEVSLVRRVLSEQELNRWGLKEEGNIGFKKTREV